MARLILKYFVENSHEPILSAENFERVQTLTQSRRVQAPSGKAANAALLAKKILCDNCGTVFWRKIDSGKVYWTKVNVRSRRLGSTKSQINTILHKTTKTIVFDLFDDIIVLWSICNA